MLQARKIVSIAGNHDLIGTGLLGFERCSNKAMHALKRTRQTLRPDTAEYLRTLPRALLVENSAVLVHGGVRDVQQYMTRPQHVDETCTTCASTFQAAASASMATCMSRGFSKFARMTAFA